MIRYPWLVLVASSLAVMTLMFHSAGQDQPKPKLGYKDTPMLPGGQWHVHDGDRPLPPVITPGTCSTQEAPGKAPSDAVVLFDGKDLSHWRSERGGRRAGTSRTAPWSSGRARGPSSAGTSSATASSTSSSPRPSRREVKTRAAATAA